MIAGMMRFYPGLSLDDVIDMTPGQIRILARAASRIAKAEAGNPAPRAGGSARRHAPGKGPERIVRTATMSGRRAP